MWTPILFFIQAVFFMIPHYIWRLAENGLMTFFCYKMKLPEIDENLRNKRVEQLVKLFSMYKQRNQTYAILMISVEFLEFVNCLLQFYVLNVAINGQFLTFGIDYFMSENIVDFIFPKLAKCQYNRFGPGGDLINHDALCLLPLNVLHDKMFLFAWVYFIFLASASMLLLLYRSICLCSKRLRRMTLQGSSNERTLKSFCDNAKFGDYIVVCQISKNVDMESFNNFMLQLISCRNKYV